MSSEKASVRKETTKGCVVPSRYKQAAKAISSQSSKSKDKSPLKSSDLMLYSTINMTQRNSSPSRNAKKFTSTPDSNGHQPLPPIDASAITETSCFLRVPESCNGHQPISTVDASAIPETSCFLHVPVKKAPVLPATTSAAAKKILQKNKLRDLNSTNIMPVNASQKKRGKTSQAIVDEEVEIDLLYAEYLQAKLLESNAKKALEMRYKDGLEKIHAVWCLLQELMGKNEETRKTLNFVSYYTMLHTHLQKQEEMLLSALEIIPTLETQYEDMSKAVHAMRHKMEVKDMFLPSASSQGEISELLQKIKIFILNILNVLSDCDKIIATAESGHLFVNQGKLVWEEIKRSQNLLSDASNLLLDEMSLSLTSF